MPRRGSTLLLVLLVLAVMSVLAVSSVLATLREVRAGRRQALQVRAQAVAEYGLNIQLAAWPASRADVVVGGTDTQQVGVAPGDTATVTVVRLDAATYLVTSVGRAGIGTSGGEAERAVSQVVRRSAMTVAPESAITLRSALDLRGSYLVSGLNTPPTGWTDCAAGPNAPAITYNAAAPPTIQKPGNVLNGTLATSAAARAATYDALWNMLVGLATISLSTDVSPVPVGSSASCVASGTNWGEPLRGGSSVAGCQSRFPVILLSGDRQLNSGRGQGILLVDGSLRINGNFTFAGLLLVRGQFDLLGTANLFGGVYVQDAAAGGSRIRGNGQLAYSSCAIANATNGLGGVGRVTQRPWAGLY